MNNSEDSSFNFLEVDTSKPLTEWENEPKVSDLKQDLQEAKVDHDTQVLKINVWLDNLNTTGSAAVEKKQGRSSIVPKLIRKQAEWRYAALSEPFLSTEDVFNIDPVTYEDKYPAIQNELVLNNQFNTKLDKVKFIDDYVRTAVDEGTVIVRVGWEYEEEEIEVEQPIFNMVPIRDPILAQSMLAQGQQPYEQIQAGTELVTETKIIKNQPTLDICDYNNIVIDPTCEGNLDKANFIIYSFETSLSELEKDGRYVNLDNINTSNNSPLANPDFDDSKDSTFTFKDEPRKKIVANEYWGFWDIHNTGIVKPIVATWVGDTLIRMEENPFPDKKLPFVIVQYLPVRKSIYGEPDGALLEDNQKIIGAVTRGMIDVMGRSANGQMATRKDALDVVNKRRFDKGLDYEFNANVDPRQAFHMHTYPEIPQSAHFMIEMQNAEAESLTGVKAFHSGISGQALGNTATGIRSALDATSKRELGILRRLAEGMKQIGRKIIAMNGAFLSDEEVVRITNEEFIPIRRDDLAGNFDLKLTISTAEADNEKAQELSFMLQTMGNNMDPEMSKMILSDIARLRKMPALAKRIQEYQPQPDPLLQKQRELEIALLEAQVFNEKAKAEENMVDRELKAAKTQNELAKAKALGSKSDLDDLDFLEKESGINHARELEKQQQKIEGDLMKERAKSLNKAPNFYV